MHGIDATAPACTADPSAVLAAVLDGFGLLHAVRDADGSVMDFRISCLRFPVRPAGRGVQTRADDVHRGRLLLDVVPAIAGNGLLDDLRHVLRVGGTLLREAVPHTDLGGDEIFLEVRMHRVDADQVAVAWREVTQRVTAERELWATLEQLCEREALHRTVLDALDEAVVLYLADGSVAMTNYAARALFGVGGSRQQIAAELHALRVEDADGVPVPVEERPVATTFRTGLPQMGAVHRVRRTDGTSAWMSTTTIPLRSDPKAPLHGVVATSMDISLQRVFEAERDRRDAEMRLMNLKLRQAQAVRDQMVAVASHELRTPLTAIVGYAGLLLDDDSDADGGTDPRDLLTDEERRDSLGRIALAARRLERLVDDLLVISSLEAGGLRLDLADHALPDLLRETLDTHPRGAEVTVTGGRDIRLHADAGRVAQILGNLLTNAFKYGAAPVAIRVDADTDLVELRVIDAGPGVPAGMESTVFGQFEQARPGSDGVGLGLWIVRALAEAHGGSAAYEAGVPHGACFVVRLPLTGPGDGQAGP